MKYMTLYLNNDYFVQYKQHNILSRIQGLDELLWTRL